MLRVRFKHPHDALDLHQNRDEGVRIAHRRWKRKRSKYLRRLHRRDDFEEQQEWLNRRTSWCGWNR